MAVAALGLCGGVLGAPAISLAAGARTEAATVTQAPDLAAQLRYIGRDTMTGLPAPVDDRFIAAHEVAIERYGKDERDAIPPPAPKEVDIASIGVADIGVTGRLARYGVDKFGRLDVPQDRVTVGWNPGFSALPGEGGATFFAAHYEYGGLAGIFNRISLLRPGAVVDVTLTDGSVARYRVTSTVDYPLGAIDMGAILLGREGRESITLMTCSGPPDEGEYPLRTVVLAERIE